MKTKNHLLVCILTIVIINSPASAQSKDTPEKFITFTLENDVFVGRDDGYTNGTGLSFGVGPFEEFDNDNLFDWQHWLTKNLYISTMKDKQRAVGNMFFQRMQTPTDITRAELIEDDLPYAAVLAWQGIMYAWDDKVSDQFSLYLGVVGPIALGEEAQKTIHGLIDSDEPMGWDNQIRNEPVIKVEAQRVWNLYRSSGASRQFDVLGLAGVGLGNLESATKGGVALRWGKNLSSSFSTFQLQADRQLNPLAISPEPNYYGFIGARGGYVLNDIFIDGNTFTDSHSVPLEHFQMEYSAGFVWNFQRCAFVFQLSSRSSPTTLSNEREEFGAFSITYKY